MAILSKGKTFSNGELVTPQKLHELVDLASITGIVTAEITDSAITTAKIADANVTTAKLADSAVTSAKIADGTIVNADISAAAAIADTKLATISTAGKVSNSATTAASTNIANAIVTRDSLGNFSAGTITAALAGTAATATKLATARTITLGGDLSGSVSFDGSANATLTAAVADDSHNHTIANIDNLQTALDGKQANLGFTPVQQGGGTNQGTNKVYIGWNSPNLRVQVDSTDFSGTWPINISGTANPTSHTHSDATTTVAGFMSAADKTKLDGATSANIANTIVVRDADQVINAYSVVADNFETASPYFSRKSGLIDTTANSVESTVLHINIGADASEVFNTVKGSAKNGTNVAIFKKHSRASLASFIIGSITATGTSTSATGVAYNTTSDYRLKTNIEPLTDAVTRLLQIPVHRFNWISDPAAPKVDGFLAHEAQVVVPESVTGHKDEVDAEGNPIHQGIDQSKLVPLLVAAVQELAARVAALESAK